MLTSPYFSTPPHHTTTRRLLPTVTATHNPISTTFHRRHYHQPHSIATPDHHHLAKRAPQFPGSIREQNALDELFEGLRSLDDESEERMVMKAVEVRRRVCGEIVKEVLVKKGKFGITYAGNLVECVGEFVDLVVLKAALLKSVEGESFNVRAWRVVEESGVVEVVRWLKHNGLSYPQIGKLICMSQGNIEFIWHRTEWLKSIHVRGRDIGVVYMKAGGNLLEKSDGELNEIVEYIERHGVRREWMGHVISRSPQLLSCSVDEVKSRVGFYLKMGMSEQDFGTMVFQFPKSLGSLTLEEMKNKADYLKEFGLNDEDVGRLLAFRPHLMGCSIEERWKPLVKYLYYLGITRDGMRRMLTLKPMVFCFDLETTIVPKVQFFKHIGVRDDAIGNMLVKFPSLLTYSLHKKIRPVVIFLITKAGVNEKDIGKVIAAGPELLGCSIAHKLDVNVKYFLSLGIRLHQLGGMITDFPLLLRYNVEILRPKYRYLRRTMVRPRRDVIEFPRFFSYSLDHRIIPRHEVLVKNRINFNLHDMLAGSDDDFNQSVEAELERRQKFESGVETFLTYQLVDESSERRIRLHSPETASSGSEMTNCSVGIAEEDISQGKDRD